MRTNDFRSDIIIRLKIMKGRQATFTHKKHKMPTKQASF